MAAHEVHGRGDWVRRSQTTITMSCEHLLVQSSYRLLLFLICRSFILKLCSSNRPACRPALRSDADTVKACKFHLTSRPISQSHSHSHSQHSDQLMSFRHLGHLILCILHLDTSALSCTAISLLQIGMSATSARLPQLSFFDLFLPTSRVIQTRRDRASGVRPICDDSPETINTDTHLASSHPSPSKCAPTRSAPRALESTTSGTTT